MSLFETGIRPKIDEHLAAKAAEKRDYGDYWSASSAGYCMRKNIFDRLHLPLVKDDPRKQRVFEVGHIFHEWAQRITREAGLSIVQELELQDEELKVRGHIDDLVLVDGPIPPSAWGEPHGQDIPEKHLVLYDYKTQNSRAFSWQKDRPMSHYHRMQLGTYMYMLRKDFNGRDENYSLAKQGNVKVLELTEARILKISKDDLRMSEQQLLWSPELEREITSYWQTLEAHWQAYKAPDRASGAQPGDVSQLPPCTCHEQENGFMAKPDYNPYHYNGQPCSTDWLLMHRREAVMEP